MEKNGKIFNSQGVVKLIWLNENHLEIVEECSKNKH